MSQSTHQSTDHKRQSQNKNQTHAYAKVWLYFMYYWMIFGIGCYFGQYLPMSWRKPLSLGLLILILATLFIKRARKYGLVISHIYAIIVGLLSYALFTTYLQNLGAEVFYKNIIRRQRQMCIRDRIIAGIIGIFINNPIFHTVITIVSLLLFLLYTLYDFNRMKRGQFSPREMGFNLFINLLNIIEDILSLANRFKN